MVILISDKIDYKSKTVARHKEGHYIMLKGSIQQEDITIINVYATNIRVPKYMKETLTELKEGIDRSTITLGNLNIPLSLIDRTIIQILVKKK